MVVALAQYERALIRERVIAGLRAAERRGRQGGRPRALDAEKIEAAKELLAGGRTASAAARTLGIRGPALLIVPLDFRPPISSQPFGQRLELIQISSNKITYSLQKIGLIKNPLDDISVSTDCYSTTFVRSIFPGGYNYNRDVLISIIST